MSTAYTREIMIHIEPMASPASTFLESFRFKVSHPGNDLPVVLRLREAAGSGSLDPLLAVPGDDGTDPRGHEHEGSDQIPNRL